MKRFLYTILPFLLLCSQLYKLEAQQIYTLEECYRLVDMNYPLVKRYDLLEKAEEFTLKNAYTKYFPQISFSASASWQTESLTFPFLPDGVVAPDYSRDHYNTVIEVSQVLWDGGEIAAERANIKAKSKIDKQEHNINMYSLREQVNGIYFGILLLKEQRRLTDIMLGQLDTEYERVVECIRNGVANDSDLDLIQVEILTQKQNVADVESRLEAYLGMLSLMTGVKIDSPDMLVAPLDENVDMEYLLDTIISAQVKRPELELYDARLEQIDTQLKYWIAGGMPELKLFARGGFGRPAFDIFNDSFRPYAIAGVSLQWNISELYSISYGKKAVKYNKQQVEAVRETFLYNNMLQANEKVSEVRRYISVVNDDSEIVKLMEKIRKSVETGVENGTKNATDLIHSISKEDVAKKQLILHKIELMKSLYELKNIKNI